MSRNHILFIGAVLWTAVAVDTIVHLAAVLAVAIIAWRRARRPAAEAA